MLGSRRLRLKLPAGAAAGFAAPTSSSPATSASTDPGAERGIRVSVTAWKSGTKLLLRVTADDDAHAHNDRSDFCGVRGDGVPVLEEQGSLILIHEGEVSARLWTVVVPNGIF